MTRLMIPARLRALLVDLLGRTDERWYWFYQDALCRLGQDPRAADAMYAAQHSPHLSTCGTAAFPRAPRAKWAP